MRRRAGLAPAALAAGALALPGEALAHGAERGFVMLLPTGHVIAGGALAVAASFVVALALPGGLLRKLAAARLPLLPLPDRDPLWPSCLAALLLLFLIATGFFGYRDPLGNLLPLTIWTVFWVGMPLLQAVAGDVWSLANPFIGPYRLLDRATGGALSGAARPLPPALGHLPALAIFLAFAWFELVHPAPDDPATLAQAVGIYAIVTFACLVTFGPEAWFGRGDPFAVFFRYVALIAPLGVRTRPDGRRRLELRLPGAGILERPPMPLSGVVFVLVTLSTVSFDAFSRSFLWLAAIGVNPLEFPGRSAVIGANTLGLLLAALLLVGAFLVAVEAGRRLAGRPLGAAALAGHLVLSVVPISIAFHLSHYLTALLVNGQYALKAAGDPFGLGWDLLGWRDAYVTTSFLATAEGSTAIYTLQTAVIIIGHGLAVIAAHAIVDALVPDRGRALRLELPLTLAMVGYTAAGLWLLSTPVAG